VPELVKNGTHNQGNEYSGGKREYELLAGLKI
jgi:hypothetical protein